MIRRIALSWWARAALTVVVGVLLASRVDVRASLAALRRLDFGLAFIVLLLLAVDRAIMIWRWIVLLRARSIPITARSATYIFLVSSFVGSYTAFAGDAARAYSLTRRTAQGGEALASVAVDRLLGLIGILGVALTGAAVAGARLTQQSELAFGAAAILLISLTASALYADQLIRVTVPSRWSESAVARRARSLAAALGAYRGHRGALVTVTVLSVGVQVLRVLQAYLLGVAIGITVPFSYYLLFMPAGLVALMLPISIGGFGAPQGLIVWLLQPRGVPAADALALSTLIVLSGLLTNVPGAVLMALGRRERAAH